VVVQTESGLRPLGSWVEKGQGPAVAEIRLTPASSRSVMARRFGALEQAY
jgi:hypothetical protein